MTDLIEKIFEIITFGQHGNHGIDDIVLFLISLGIWFVIYKVCMYLMGLR
jgi:hypothetical protein